MASMKAIDKKAIEGSIRINESDKGNPMGHLDRSRVVDNKIILIGLKIAHMSAIALGLLISLSGLPF